MSENVLANWNGKLMPLSEVRVSVLDRAFLFGDSVYEVVRIYQGRLFRLDDHLQRLANSLAALRIRFDSFNELRRRIVETVRASDVLEGIAYIQITRGEAPRTHRYPADSTPNVLIYSAQFQPPSLECRANGVKVITHPDIRWGRNDIKQTGMTANCMVAQIAFERGCPEAILIDSDGYITEGTHTSIIGIKDGTILVPPASPKVLPGITKMLIKELARDNGIPVVETWIKAEEMYSLDELFLASTTQEVLPIVAVDDRQIAAGIPGPMVQRLEAAYQKMLTEWLAGEEASAAPFSQ